MPELDVRRLLILREVGKAGGILAAAEAMHITASAVSQQLTKLEAETNLRLVSRAGNARVTLTPAGLRLASRADAIARELRQASSDVADLSAADSTSFTVAAFPTALVALVAPAAANLAGAGSPVSVRAVEDRLTAIQQSAALRQGSIDFSISKLAASELDEGVVEHVLLDDPYRIVVPSSWAAPSSLKDLVGVPWVGVPRDFPDHRVLAAIAEREGAELDFAHECVEYPGALAIVRAGLAAAVVPALGLLGAEHPGVRVLDLGGLGFRRIVVRHRRELTAAPATAALLDELRARARAAAIE